MVSEPAVQALHPEFGVVEKIVPSRLEIFLTHPVVDELPKLPDRGAKRKVRVGRYDRTKPYAEKLLMPGNVGERELARSVLYEFFDVGVVSVIQPPLGAEFVHEHAVEGAMVTEVCVRDQQRIEIGIGAGDLVREAQANGGGVGRFLGDLYLEAVTAWRLRNFDPCNGSL